MENINTDEYLMYDDFHVIPEVFLTSAEYAARVLRSARRKNCRYVRRDGAEYKFEKDAVICPNCGTRLHLYDKEASPARKMTTRQLDAVVEELLSDQISLFGNTDREELEMHSSIAFDTEIACFRCGTRGYLREDAKARRVQIGTGQGKMSVSCELRDVFETLSVGWLSAVEEEFAIKTPPYSEEVVFDLDSGITKIRITEGGGTVCEKVLTSEAELTGWSAISAVFGNYVLRRRIRKAFAAAYDGELCFGKDELCLDRYILLTKFIGYNRDFYDYIPFIDDDSSSIAQGRRRLPESKLGIAEQMHRAKDIPDLYAETGLPSAKSIKRIVFEKPQLMFYADELKILSEVFDDVNFFRGLVERNTIYDILSFNIDLKRTKAFLVFVRGVLGKRRLFDTLNSFRFVELFNHGILYDAMSDEAKSIYRGRIMNSPSPEEEIMYNTHGMKLSSLMTHMSRKGYDWNCSGYRFQTLRTTFDYEKAGKDLNNCLGSSYGFAYLEQVIGEGFEQPELQCGRTVVGVMKNGRYVAAVEVDDKGEVKHSESDHNKPIEMSPKILDAYVTWLKRFRLKDWSLPLGTAWMLAENHAANNMR